MMKLPTIKKTISSFLLNEEGKISKHSLLKLGILALGATVLTSLISKGASAGHGSANCHQNGHASGNLDSRSVSKHCSGYDETCHGHSAHGQCVTHVNCPACQHANNLNLVASSGGVVTVQHTHNAPAIDVANHAYGECHSSD